MVMPTGPTRAFNREGPAVGHDNSFDETRVGAVEHAVRGEHVEHTRRAVDREGLAFAQTQQAGDRVDVAIGQDHGLDRAVARALVRIRIELRRVIDLLTKIGGSVEQIHWRPSALTATDAWLRGERPIFP